MDFLARGVDGSPTLAAHDVDAGSHQLFGESLTDTGRAFKRFVSEEDLQALAAYVRWLADGQWHDRQLSLPSSGTAPPASSRG